MNLLTLDSSYGSKYKLQYIITRVVIQKWNDFLLDTRSHVHSVHSMEFHDFRFPVNA